MNLFFEFFPFILIALFLLVFLVLLPRKDVKRSLKIIQFYGGKISWPLGRISLSFKDVAFDITRIGRGGSYAGGGSYPVLSSYVKPFPKFIFGSESCHKYALGAFLVLPQSKTIEISGKKYFVASPDMEILEKIESLKDHPVVVNLAAALFVKEFHHLTINRQLHWRGLSFKRENTLMYTCLPEIIYENPDQLRPFLENLTEFCRVLDLTRIQK